MITNLIIGFGIALAAVIYNWQKDKTSFAASLKAYWLLYIAVFIVTTFLTGWLLDSAIGRRIFQVSVGGAVVFYWGFFKGLIFKK